MQNNIKIILEGINWKKNKQKMLREKIKRKLLHI
jgi:hypothetical protein